MTGPDPMDPFSNANDEAKHELLGQWPMPPEPQSAVPVAPPAGHASMSAPPFNSRSTVATRPRYMGPPGIAAVRERHDPKTKSRRPWWLPAALIVLAMMVALVPTLWLLGADVAPGGAGGASTATARGPHVRQPYVPPKNASRSQLDGLASLTAGARLAYVNALISRMPLDAEIGQLTMIGFTGTSVTPDLAAWVREYQPGSVILYDRNLQSKAQAQALIQQLQADSTVPLLVMVDQEGGSVDRMWRIDGPAPSAAYLGARGDTSVAERQGAFDAANMAAVGVNVNLAPVVDVSSVPGGQGALYGRTFSTSPTVVTTIAGAYLTGLQQSGKVVGVLKHFPGLGSAATDPHLQLPTVTRSRAQLEATDWAPYKALLATGQVHMIMTTHVLVPALDSTYPATISSTITTGILRHDLGFQGVITTDDVFMGAMRLNYPMDEVFTRAVLAGNDIICCTWSTDETAYFVSTIQGAVAGGTISKARLDESVRRILLLKMQLGLPMPKVK